jgi:hypothetical protein
MSDSPDAMRNRNIAAVSPLSDCAKTNEGSGIYFFMLRRASDGVIE